MTSGSLLQTSRRCGRSRCRRPYGNPRVTTRRCEEELAAATGPWRPRLRAGEADAPTRPNRSAALIERLSTNRLVRKPPLTARHWNDVALSSLCSTTTRLAADSLNQLPRVPSARCGAAPAVGTALPAHAAGDSDSSERHGLGSDVGSGGGSGPAV